MALENPWDKESKHTSYVSLKSKGDSVVGYYLRVFKEFFMLIKLTLHWRNSLGELKFYLITKVSLVLLFC